MAAAARAKLPGWLRTGRPPIPPVMLNALLTYFREQKLCVIAHDAILACTCDFPAPIGLPTGDVYCDTCRFACATCAQPFVPPHPDAEYCTDACDPARRVEAVIAAASEAPVAHGMARPPLKRKREASASAASEEVSSSSAGSVSSSLSIIINYILIAKDIDKPGTKMDKEF